MHHHAVRLANATIFRWLKTYVGWTFSHDWTVEVGEGRNNLIFDSITISPHEMIGPLQMTYTSACNWAKDQNSSTLLQPSPFFSPTLPLLLPLLPPVFSSPPTFFSNLKYWQWTRESSKRRNLKMDSNLIHNGHSYSAKNIIGQSSWNSTTKLPKLKQKFWNKNSINYIIKVNWNGERGSARSNRSFDPSRHDICRINSPPV